MDTYSGIARFSLRQHGFLDGTGIITWWTRTYNRNLDFISLLQKRQWQNAVTVHRPTSWRGPDPNIGLSKPASAAIPGCTSRRSNSCCITINSTYKHQHNYTTTCIWTQTDNNIDYNKNRIFKKLNLLSVYVNWRLVKFIWLDPTRVQLCVSNIFFWR